MSQSNTQTDSSGPPKPVSIFLFSDHSIKAEFVDGTIILVNCDATEVLIAHKPSLRNITTVLPSDVQQFKTKFLLTKHIPLLAPLIAFKNLHVEIPTFIKQLLPSSEIFQTNSQLRFSHWALPKDVYVSNCVFFHTDDNIAFVTVVSSDELVRLTLSRHLQSFQIQYPALVSNCDMKWKQRCNYLNRTGSLPPKGHQEYEYVWHTQIFSTRYYPPRWQYPLYLALRAALIHSLSSPDPGISISLLESLLSSNQHPSNHSTITHSPGSENHIDTPTEDIAVNLNQLVGCLVTATHVLVDLPNVFENTLSTVCTTFMAKDSIYIADASIPQRTEVLYCWIPSATFLGLPNKDVIMHLVDDSVIYIPSEVHDGSSTIAVHDYLDVQHGNSLGSARALYSVQAIPPKVIGSTKLSDIIQLGMQLQTHNVNFQPPTSHSPIETWEEISAVILTQMVVHEVGVFTAFKGRRYSNMGLTRSDGTVQVRFTDHTAMTIKKNRLYCTILTKEAQVLNLGCKVVVSNPWDPNYKYVKLGLEFASQVFDGQYDTTHDRQTAVNAMLQRIQTAITFHEMSRNKHEANKENTPNVNQNPLALIQLMKEKNSIRLQSIKSTLSDRGSS